MAAETTPMRSIFVQATKEDPRIELEVTVKESSTEPKAQGGAAGKVFLRHFESGGTLLDFDPNAMRAHFRQEFKEAKDEVSRMHKQEVKTEVRATAVKTI